MIIKAHLCGVAIAYEPHTFSVSQDKPKTGRIQGSRYGQQKRKIADACEWIRLNGKALIFVVTAPGYTAASDERHLIQRFTHNLRNGYGVKDYVWVRELTKKGFPHYHFVVNASKLPAVQLSLYWSSLFGSTAKNSIRFGSKPNRHGKRIFFIRSSKQAWYLCKYIGKNLGDDDGEEQQRRVRSFHVSRDLAISSAPILYGEEIIHSQFTHLHSRKFVIANDHELYYEQGRAPPEFNPHSVAWRWTGHGQTYIGRPKNWKTKT